MANQYTSNSSDTKGTSATRSALNVIYGDIDQQMEFQREMELQKLKNSPKTKGISNEALDKLEGHTNEVRQMLSEAEKIESVLTSLPPDQLTTEKGQALLQRYTDLTSPSRLNTLKRSLEYSKQAMEDNKNHDARDAIVSLEGKVYVKDLASSQEIVKTVSRSEVMSNRQRYKPLSSAELMLLRDQREELAGDSKVTAAIATIEGMSRVNTAIEGSIKGIGESDVDAEFSGQLKSILAANGNITSNSEQAGKALNYIKSSLTQGMLETLRNQAMLNVDDERLIDNWVINLLAEKAASYYKISTEAGTSKDGGQDRGVFANIAAGSAALDWRTMNLISAKDKTEKQEVYQTVVPPNQMDALEEIALVHYPGEQRPTNRPLSEITTPILLADGTQIYADNIEGAEKIYLTKPTGKVLRMPDPIYKAKYDQYLKDANQLATRIKDANESEQEVLRAQMKSKQTMLDAVPTKAYFEYIAIMEAAVASQALFSQVIDGKEQKVVEGTVVKSVAENNAYGMKEHKGEFYDAKFGGIINNAIEMPIFIRIDNLSYMDNKSDKYTKMLVEEKKTQEKANEMNVRMTSRPII